MKYDPRHPRALTGTPHQGIRRRLGRTKGSLGCNVPPISKGIIFLGHRTSPTYSHELGQADVSESSILITEPYFNLPQIQRIYDQFVFEEYGFQSYYRCTRWYISDTKVPTGDSHLS